MLREAYKGSRRGLGNSSEEKRREREREFLLGMLIMLREACNGSGRGLGNSSEEKREGEGRGRHHCIEIDIKLAFVNSVLVSKNSTTS